MTWHWKKCGVPYLLYTLLFSASSNGWIRRLQLSKCQWGSSWPQSNYRIGVLVMQMKCQCLWNHLICGHNGGQTDSGKFYASFKFLLQLKHRMCLVIPFFPGTRSSPYSYFCTPFFSNATLIFTPWFCTCLSPILILSDFPEFSTIGLYIPNILLC